MRKILRGLRKFTAFTVVCAMTVTGLFAVKTPDTVFAASHDEKVVFETNFETNDLNVTSTTSTWDFSKCTAGAVAENDTAQGLILSGPRVIFDAGKDLNIKNSGGAIWVPLKDDTTKIELSITPMDADPSRYVEVKAAGSGLKLVDNKNDIPSTTITIRDVTDWVEVISGKRYIKLVSGGNFKMADMTLKESNIVTKVTVSGVITNWSDFSGIDITSLSFKNKETDDIISANVDASGSYSVELANEYSYVASVNGSYSITADTKEFTLNKNNAAETINFTVLNQPQATLSGSITITAQDNARAIDAGTFRVTLAPSDDTLEKIPLTLSPGQDAYHYTYSDAKIVPNMEYTVELTEENDYMASSTIQSDDAAPHTADINIVGKPVYTVSLTPVTSDRKAALISSITVTNMDDNYTYSFNYSGGSAKPDVTVRNGSYEVTAVSSNGGYLAQEHFIVADSNVPNEDMYLYVADITEYDLPTEVNNSGTTLSFNNITFNNSTSVKGSDGSSVTVPVTGKQKVTVAIWYSGTIDINGQNEVTADSSSNATKPVTSTYTTNGTETSVTINCKGSAQTYLYWVKVEKVEETAAYRDTVKVGKDQEFKTITDAIRYIKTMGERTADQRVTVLLCDELYREQVIVDTPYVTFASQASSPSTITWYYGLGKEYYSVKNDGKTAFYDEGNAVDKYQKAAVGQSPGNWGSTVNLTAAANGFCAENVIFENSFNRYVTDEEIADGCGRTKDTDVKAYVNKERACTMYNRGADKIEFYNCQFLSSQDTFYTGDANEYSYYYNCLFEGTTDYICGDGNAVFDQCTLSWYGHTDRENAGVILASKGAATYGYLFNGCTITTTEYPGIITPPAGNIGRPWNTDTEKVVFANTVIDGDLILPAAWTTMSASYPPENCALYEYNTVYADGTKADLSQRRCHVLEDISEYPMSKYLNGWTPVYLGADYSKVTEQIFEVNKLNPEEYSNFKIVTDAVNAVVTGKLATEQASVNAMADAIKDAISKLTKGTPPVDPDIPAIPVDPKTFVDRLYTLVLGRDPDEKGHDDWTNSLIEQRSSGVDIGYGFVFSQECKERKLTNEEFVEMLYNTYLGRPSDADGKAAWVSQLDAGVDREKVFEGFAMSDEFSGICTVSGINRGSISDVPQLAAQVSAYRNQNANLTKFVAGCYEHAFERTYDLNGLEDWCRTVINGINTPKQAAQAFIFSDEFTKKNLNNEEYITTLYHLFLHREPDAEGLAAWVHVLESGKEDRAKVLEGFSDSVEFDSILEGFNLN